MTENIIISGNHQIVFAFYTEKDNNPLGKNKSSEI